MNRIIFLWMVLARLFLFYPSHSHAQQTDSTRILIKKSADFQVDGTGSYAGWDKTNWVTLPVQTSTGRALTTAVKLLYSDTGLYFMFQCDDQKLTATIQEDFGALYTEDVVEVFLWPDPLVPIYFEYELSPLNYELPILVPNINGNIQGWQVWRPSNSPKTQHATRVQGGDRKSNAVVIGWTAEFFIPYALMKPIVPAVPTSGTEWRGNLYRIDYDKGYQTWAWQKTSGSFHEFRKFGLFVFE